VLLGRGCEIAGVVIARGGAHTIAPITIKYVLPILWARWALHHIFI
jgi:hypothetical protein